MYLFGNVTTHYYGGMRKLEADNRGRAFYLVEVSNTNKTGVKTDERWDLVVPSWKDLVQPYINGTLTEGAYRHKYGKALDSKLTFIKMEWEDIKKRAQGKTIVFLCYESYTFCHREVLINWMFEEGMVNAILNRDTIMCAGCYDQYSEYERELEANLVMGYTTTKCVDCFGFDDGGPDDYPTKDQGELF